MSKKKKVSADKKLMAVKEYLDGNGSLTTVGIKYGVSESSFRKWVAKYRAFGDSAFVQSRHCDYYTPEFKMHVVIEYINGKGSLYNLAIKYKIPSHTTLSGWIFKYNSHEELITSRTGGNLTMTKGRKTTYDERIEIVKYCIEHRNNYAETAEKYQVSYQQVYAWIKKHEEKGVEGLLDRRGRTKPEDEMSELEKLRAENRILKAQNKRQEMEMEFLKKLEEIERRRFKARFEMKPSILQFKNYMKKRVALYQNCVELQGSLVHLTTNGLIVKKERMNSLIKRFFH